MHTLETAASSTLTSKLESLTHPQRTTSMEIEGTVARSGCGRCWTIFQLCNTILVLLLTGVVVYLGLQMQQLNGQVLDQEVEIQEIKTQVQTKQEGQIQELHEAVEQEHNLTLGTLAGTFTLLTCLISMFHMSSHLQKYNEPVSFLFLFLGAA